MDNVVLLCIIVAVSNPFSFKGGFLIWGMSVGTSVPMHENVCSINMLLEDI